MRVCLSCAAEILSASWSCGQCGWRADHSAGFPAFAPHLSGATDSYDPAWYEELASLEATNFWFVARNELIQSVAKRFVPPQGRYLEVGCGTGFVLQMMHRTFPQWQLVASEAQREGIAFAQQRVPDRVEFCQMDACAIPYKAEFDVIGAFDVIEHIPDDTLAIAQIHAALRPNGYFLVSVPQHMFLWSRFDELSRHFRRYSSSDLATKLSEAGFTIRFSTSFTMLLLPAMLLSRMMNRRKAVADVDVLDELRLSPIVNRLLTAVMRVELWFVRRGVRLPAGGSRVIVAQKVSSSAR